MATSNTAVNDSQAIQGQPDRQLLAAENLAKGMPIKHALIAAGYPETSAKQGKRAISNKTIELLSRKNRHYAVIGRLFNAEQRADIVRGKLLENVSTGKDSATKSCELLGKDTEVAIFRADQNQVQVNIAIPQGMQALFAPVSGESENKSVQENQDGQQ